MEALEIGSAHTNRTAGNKKKITKKQQQQQKSAAAKEPWEAQNQFGLVHFDAKAIAL